MALEQTLSIIKPDAVAKDIIGNINSRIEENGLHIVAAKMLHLTRSRAKEFYAVHHGQPFYNLLIEFMISGPVMVQVLEGDSAITKYRQIMGATNPANAAPGTIRHNYARDGNVSEVHENAVHGSDSEDNARAEIDFFFKPEEIYHRTR